MRAVSNEHGCCHGNGPEAAEGQRPADTGVGIQGAGSCEQRPGVFAAEKQGQPGPYEKLEKYVRITKYL